MLPTHHGSRWAVLSRGARQTLFTLWKVIQQSSVLQPAVFSLTGYWFSVPSILIKSLNWECAEINNPELTISWQMDLWIIPWSLVRRLSGVFLWVFTKGLNTYTSQNVHVLFCCSDLPRARGFHADPLDQAFLQVPGVQQVLFYPEGPRCLTHPTCRYKEQRLWQKSEKDAESLCKMCS